MKRSIILLITLSFILALGSLFYMLTTSSDQARKSLEAKRSLIQKTILFQNILTILKQRVKIDSAQALQILFATPLPLQTKQFDLLITFQPVAYGVNPNNLIKKRGKKAELDPNLILLFDRILLAYGVQQKELFLAMLEDTLDSDLHERFAGSELTLYDKRFSQGRIDRKKFAMIIDWYKRRTLDPSIDTVPWDELITFHSDSIDINYISPTLLHFILPPDASDLAQNIVQNRGVYESLEALPLPKKVKKRLKRYGIKSFVPIAQGTILLKEGKKSDQLRFIYDFKQKKVLDIALF